MSNKEILKKMFDDGYFRKGIVELDKEHELRNYEKAKMWASTNNIPDWLIKDMQEYDYDKNI